MITIEIKEILNKKVSKDVAKFLDKDGGLKSYEKDSLMVFLGALTTNAPIDKWQKVQLGKIIIPDREYSLENYIREFYLLEEFIKRNFVVLHENSQKVYFILLQHIKDELLNLENLPKNIIKHNFILKCNADFIIKKRKGRKRKNNNEILSYYYKDFKEIWYDEFK